MNANDSTAAALGAIIRRAAEDRDMTLVELAERSGVPRGSLYRYIDGDRDMTLPTIESIAAALGLDPGAMIQDAIQQARRNARSV
ncbi:helix-turn-helix transcriptional regulator [Brachybacterium sp. HMSC06H03]|uniref:helix-turn-helix domain-containing protein n=1 Tax=Brachybacterium sp. HMSC06H03 TaxID=1581127 RepID=UPI0014397B69|nr:helix-turn-helix transcriptional regulator [Brachybacterium sp. HMSC06H03]